MVAEGMTDIRLTFDSQGVNWEKAATIFERAPLGTRDPKDMEQAYAKSDLVCFAWADGELIGLARALSDGVYQSVIYDLCMLPEHQGNGLGTRMMNAMLEKLNTPNMVLWSVPGKESFYARFGFKPMLTAMARFKDPEQSAQNGYIALPADDSA